MGKHENVYSSCKNTWHDFFPVSRHVVTKILVAVFLRIRLTLITTLELGRKIIDVNDFSITFLHMKNKTEVFLSHTSGLIIQLLASITKQLLMKDVEGDAFT